MKGTPNEMRNAPGGPRNSYDVVRGFKSAGGSDLAFFTADIIERFEHDGRAVNGS
jgi:hypothetical protein